MRISVSFGLVTECCVTNYPEAHHLKNKHLSFLIVSVVCEFDRKLVGQLSCGLSQEVESEENQDWSPLKSLFGLEGVCRRLAHRAGKLALPLDREPEFLSKSFLQ